jgi:hypothetical protein
MTNENPNQLYGRIMKAAKDRLERRIRMAKKDYDRAHEAAETVWCLSTDERGRPMRRE